MVVTLGLLRFLKIGGAELSEAMPEFHLWPVMEGRRLILLASSASSAAYEQNASNVSLSIPSKRAVLDSGSHAQTSPSETTPMRWKYSGSLATVLLYVPPLKASMLSPAARASSSRGASRRPSYQSPSTGSRPRSAQATDALPTDTAWQYSPVDIRCYELPLHVTPFLGYLTFHQFRAISPTR